jgi:hypothetical protein
MDRACAPPLPTVLKRRACTRVAPAPLPQTVAAPVVAPAPQAAWRRLRRLGRQRALGWRGSRAAWCAQAVMRPPIGVLRRAAARTPGATPFVSSRSSIPAAAAGRWRWCGRPVRPAGDFQLRRLTGRRKASGFPAPGEKLHKPQYSCSGPGRCTVFSVYFHSIALDQKSFARSVHLY